MKKITILLTILCAGQLYGMEPEPGIIDLPWDVRHEIVKKAIESSDTIEDAVKAVKVACELQGACYNNLKDFTKLVGILQSKFPNMPREAIARKFNTSTAKEYLSLADRFRKEVINEGNTAVALNNAQILLDAGVDPNYAWGKGSASFLGVSIFSTKFNKEDKNRQDIVDLLIKYGAIQ